MLAAHPAVALVAVGPVADDVRGELARAYVVLREGTRATEAELIDFCGDRLAAYKRPRSVVFVTALPQTSTGKISPAATLPVIHVMLQAVRDFHAETGERRSVKAAGGIRTTKEAIRFLVAVNEVAGPEWLSPRMFRFGASSLLNDLLMQRRFQLTGAYSGPSYVTVD